MSIEDFSLTKAKADLVVCVQTINTNEDFSQGIILTSISALIEAVEPNGTLIFNVGSRTRPIAGLEPEIGLLLGGAFSNVCTRKYGAFARPCNKYLHHAIVAMMVLCPPLRTMFGSQHRKNYYLCEGKY